MTHRSTANIFAFDSCDFVRVNIYSGNNSQRHLSEYEYYSEIVM